MADHQDGRRPGPGVPRLPLRGGELAIWDWRYELGLSAGLAAVVLASGYALGAAWLIAIAATGLAWLAAGLARPPSRRRLIGRVWCLITPHRVRTGCRHAWVRTRDGRPPVILYTTPAAFGERVALWCGAGITRGDLEAARDVLRAACWASDVRVVASARCAHIVVLEVIRGARLVWRTGAPPSVRMNRKGATAVRSPRSPRSPAPSRRG